MYSTSEVRFMKKAHGELQEAMRSMACAAPIRVSITDPRSAARERIAKAIDFLARELTGLEA